MFFFIGSYTDAGAPAPDPKGVGISCCSFDPLNGIITFLDSYFQRNPSYPVVSADGTTLYAAEEMFASGHPMLVAYRILEDGRLSKLNEVPINGDYACHLTIANQTILVANYVSSDILVYDLKNDGQVGSLKQHIVHHGAGTHASRQEAPHPHMMFPLNNQTVYCIDLGIDMAKAYQANAMGKWVPFTALDIKVKAGAGARHIDMDETKEMMALIGELSGELFLYKKSGEAYKLVDEVAVGEKEMSAAALRIHGNGRFVYCSERTTNSIYAFMIVNNKWQTIGCFSSKGITPRDISIDPTGRWLLVANQDSNTIAVFSIDLQSGELEFARSYNVATPSCICWQTQRGER